MGEEGNFLSGMRRRSWNPIIGFVDRFKLYPLDTECKFDDRRVTFSRQGVHIISPIRQKSMLLFVGVLSLQRVLSSNKECMCFRWHPQLLRSSVERRYTTESLGPTKLEHRTGKSFSLRVSNVIVSSRLLWPSQNVFTVKINVGQPAFISSLRWIDVPSNIYTPSGALSTVRKDGDGTVEWWKGVWHRRDSRGVGLRCMTQFVI